MTSEEPELLADIRDFITVRVQNRIGAFSLNL